jgi:alpha-glucosidase (family GH31 glycosyl hydrolase)
MLDLRYRLLPYNYTMAYRNYESGLPLARPLIMMYPGEARFTDESSTYLWGDDFLVSPVVRGGDTTKLVDFPDGDWVNFWTDETVRGGRALEVSAPLGKIPLFVKSGSIIPMARPMKYSDERPLDTLDLRVYPGPALADSAFLYEDDGKTTAYQAGICSLTRFTQSATERSGLLHVTIRIGPAEGDYPGKLRRRVYDVELRRVGGRPGEVRVNGVRVPELPPGLRGTPGGPAYLVDRGSSRLQVLVPCDLDSAYTLSLSFPPAH